MSRQVFSTRSDHAARRALGAAGLCAALLAGVAALAAPTPTVAQPTVGHTALAPERPRTDTMRVLDGEVTDIEQVGSRIVIAGTFTKVRDVDGTVLTQRYLAAYDANTGAMDRGFDPVIDKAVSSSSVSSTPSTPAPSERSPS
jgi:trimeric autotransporter adhesin